MLPTHNQLQKMSGAPRSKAITIRFSDWLASGSLPAKMVGYVLGALIGLGFPSSLPLVLLFLFLLWRAEARHRKTLEAWYLDNWIDLEAATLLAISEDGNPRRR